MKSEKNRWPLSGNKICLFFGDLLFVPSRPPPGHPGTFWGSPGSPFCEPRNQKRSPKRWPENGSVFGPACDQGVVIHTLCGKHGGQKTAALFSSCRFFFGPGGGPRIGATDPKGTKRDQKPGYCKSPKKPPGFVARKRQLLFFFSGASNTDRGRVRPLVRINS